MATWRSAGTVTIVAACLVAGCNSAKDASDAGPAGGASATTEASTEMASAETKSAAGAAEVEDVVLVPLQTSAPQGKDDPIMGIESMTAGNGIAGPFVVAEVRFGGGCKEHAFTAHWDGTWIKTNPDGLPVTLRHDAKGDSCKAIVTRKLQINLNDAAKDRHGGYYVELNATGAGSKRVDIPAE